MKKFLSLIALVAIVSALAPSALLAQTSNLDLGNNYVQNFREVAGYGEASITEVVGNIIKIVLSLLGLVAVVLVIIGGFQWMASAGNEDKIKSAKKLIGSALVGLIIVVLAYAIATFVISNIVEVTEA
ncbi:MAG: hypothetical protein PHW15_01380 [Patescibacteria group bacterium]|jgi:uncharacterized membrane protein|nr:hypothetical protein [Patescibacteria group bacterium]MDD5172746.1 hypothetical protein [Patescibacteria group bacterium]